MENQNKLNKTSLTEDELEAARSERKKLMEEAARHLKGRRRLSDEELAQDPYINYKKSDE